MYLQKIVDHKRSDPNFLKGRELKQWDKIAEATEHVQRSFVESLRTTPEGQPCIIAEMKRASPSKGSFRFRGEVSDQVRQYEQGGARAISVLTDTHFFSGSLEDLTAAKASVSLPILRKDFLLETWEIAQAKACGADLVLLIAAILDQEALEKMIASAHKHGLEVLLEIHDQPELDRVLALNNRPDAIGINNRNLSTFEVSLDTTERLAGGIPKEICRISESGFATRDDLMRFKGKVDGFLIGETLMRSPDPVTTLRHWIKG